ncbi:MAG TPA: hypothetical protein VFH77_18560 [Streptomyces sp.]|nr:hypothetical protein [Streptomyces sp.]
MNAATLLTRLYPPAVRERWGADISEQVAASGVRSWADTLAGAARLWFHPGDWPETSAGQTRRVLTVALFVLVAMAGLLLRTVEPSTTLTADIRHPVSSLWLVPLLLGVVLATPLPPLRGDALRRLAVATVRALTAPAVAALAVFWSAWSGTATHLTGLAHAAAFLCYWLTLGFVALRLCTLVARVSRTAALPTTRRLSTALLCVGAGLTFASAQYLVTVLRTAPQPATLAQTAALALLATTALGVGRDLWHRPA